MQYHLNYVWYVNFSHAILKLKVSECYVEQVLGEVSHVLYEIYSVARKLL